MDLLSINTKATVEVNYQDILAAMTTAQPKVPQYHHLLKT
jgi:hypothetical protein